MLPATEYIARYYLPQLMKYENLSIPMKWMSPDKRRNPFKLHAQRGVTSSTTYQDRIIATRCTCKENSEADNTFTLSVELSHLFI